MLRGTLPDLAARPRRLRVRVGCAFDFDTDVPVPMVVLVRARGDHRHETVYESRWLEPDVRLHEYVDSYGNTCWRFTLPGGPVQLRYDALVDVAREPDRQFPGLPLALVQDLPDDVLLFTLPSRQVESDLLLNDAWGLFGQTPPTWERVQAVCDWIHGNVAYLSGASDATTTARDVFRNRVGVCRDFALLSVALCRALNIPARYACGYLPDVDIAPDPTPMDFHAWFEAFVGGQWHTFDARHNRPRVGRILIGRGRDAVDVALTTSYGPVRLERMTVWADESSAQPPTLPSG